MHRRILPFCVIFLIIIHVMTVSAEPIEKARRLMVLSQNEAMSEQIFDAILPRILTLALQSETDLSDEKKSKIADVTKQEFDAAIPEFIEVNAQAYARHFTEDELQVAIDFYETPAGQKFQKLLPLIFQETLALGQELGIVVQERAFKRLKADGVL